MPFSEHFFILAFMQGSEKPPYDLGNNKKPTEVDMFKTPLKILLAASVALPAFLAADMAQAGQKKHSRHHGGHHTSNHYSGHHYKPHHYPPVYYGGYYYGGHQGHHGHNSKAGTYAGLAILGATLGYVIHKSSQDKYNDGYQGGYYAPPPQAPQSYAPTRQSNFDFSQCQATNDYETTIIVDGQEQLAYGTACQLDDGTWVAGPMKIGR